MLAAVLDIAVRIVGVDEAVPVAALADVPEQARGLPLSGEPRELVDGGDDEGRRQPVDLLVHGEDRQASVDRSASANGHSASSSPQ